MDNTDLKSIEKSNSDCYLCGVIKEEPWVPFRLLFDKKEINNEFLFQSKNFSLVADVAPMNEGHCLIISKEHVLSVAKLNNNLLEELLHLKNRIKEILIKIYGNAIIFEHGPIYKNSNLGNCIDHLHLHLIPSSCDLHYYLSKDFNFKSISGFHEIKKFNHYNGYLLYENQNGMLFSVEVEEVPRQYFRKIYLMANSLNGEWDWQKHLSHHHARVGRNRICEMRRKILPLISKKLIN